VSTGFQYLMLSSGSRIPRELNRRGAPLVGGDERPIERRAYQEAALAAASGKAPPGGPSHPLRCFFLLWRRQAGKSTTLAEAAVREMTGEPGRLVTYASASLLMGREILYKEAAVLRRAMAQCMAQCMAERRPGAVIEAGPAGGATRLDGWGTMDDFADLFEQQRLEFRFNHGGGRMSRTVVIAPNPATARGWTGTVFLDEFGFVRDFEELWEAVEPIVSVRPDFRLVGATTPPADDAHFSHRLTEPERRDFAISASGNWYRSKGGHWVHRVDAYDAEAAGLGLYDLETGRRMTPREHLAAAPDPEAWRRNYGVEHTRGGSAAVSLDALEAAQRAGDGACRYFRIDRGDPGTLVEAAQWLRETTGAGPVGVGWDVATTDNEASNPTAVAVTELLDGRHWVRALVVWKTDRADESLERVKTLVDAVAARRAGGAVRRVCVDATNERGIAQMAARRLGSPVTPVLGGAAMEVT
jgi:hypothetical protein